MSLLSATVVALLAWLPSPTQPMATPSAASGLSHFASCPQRAGAGATLVVPDGTEIALPGGALEAGDELAVLAPDGSCAGAVAWTGEGVAVTIWEDDPFTPTLDGLLRGDVLTIVAFDASENAVATAEGLTYEAIFQPERGYRRDALYVVSSNGTSGEGLGSARTTLDPAFPNPSAGPTTIPFALAAAGDVSLEVVDMLGRTVITLADRLPYGQGPHRLAVDTGALAPGTYVYRLTADGEMHQRTLTVVR